MVWHDERRVLERREFVVVFVAGNGGADAGRARVRVHGTVVGDVVRAYVSGGIYVELRPPRDDGIFGFSYAAVFSRNAGGTGNTGVRKGGGKEKE